MTFESLMRRAAIGASLSLAVAAGPALAQDNATAGQTGQSSQSTQADQSATSGQSGEQSRSLAPETVLALVGDSEIRGADLIEFISAMPPRMRQQPPQMLMSMALDQVILRELLLQEAQAQNLAEDPRVTEIVDRNAQVAQEDAMVAVFLEDQLASRVSDEQVQQTYEQLQSQAGADQSLPPLEALRPQIERQLQQQAVQALRDELVQDVEVVVYGAGDPESQSGANASDQSQDNGSGSAEGSTSGSTSSDSQ